MKKLNFLILFFVFNNLLFGQEIIEEIGKKTCECITNNKREISFDKKFEECVPKLMANTNLKASVEEIKKNYTKIKSYVQDNCEEHIQTKKLSAKDLKAVSNDACDCIAKIESNIETRNDSISKCIDSKLSTFQLTKNLFNLDLDSTKTRPKITNIIISTGTKTKLYKQVEKELLLNCKDLKKLLMSNNSMKHINSLSFNQEATENYNIGSAYCQENQYEKAIPYLEKAVKLDSEFAYAWDNLGLSYRHTKQYDKAIKAYEKSMKIDPKGKTPIMNLGVVYEKVNKIDKAIKIYKKYINLLEYDPEGYYGISRMYFQKQNYDLSIKNIVIAYQLYTKQSSPYRADAINVLKAIYQTMKADGKENEFNKLAKKYKLNLE